jgi:hypothetical protein
MLDQTSDILYNCIYAWYDCFYCNEQNSGFPQWKMTLGRYLGKILTIDGSVVRHKPFRYLTQLQNESFKLYGIQLTWITNKG